MEVYEYFSRKGYMIANHPEEFDGKYGLGLFGKEKGRNDKRKQVPIHEQILVIGEYLPIVSTEIWLNAQYKLSRNTIPARSGTSKTTWLSGLVSCSECGYCMNLKLTYKSGKTYSYFHCRGRSSRGSSICNHIEFYQCEKLESNIKNLLFKKINSKEFIDKTSKLKVEENTELSIKKNTLLSQVYSVDSDIKNLIDNLKKGNSVIDKYLTEQITELDIKKSEILKEINILELELYNQNSKILNAEYINSIAENINNNFDNADIETKHILASAFIKAIKIDSFNNFIIEWNV